MVRIDHRIGEADHDGLGAGVDQFADLQAQVVLIQLHQHGAGVIDTLAHDAHHFRRHQGEGAVGLGQVALAFRGESFAIGTAAADVDRSLEAGGGEQADLRALALDQRVGAEGGGVTYRIDFIEQLAAADAQRFAGFIQRLVEAEGQVVLGGEGLGFDVTTFPDHEAVGEGSADIY